MRDYAQRIVDGLEPHDGAAIAGMLEDEIERRGRQSGYMNALLLIVYGEAWTRLMFQPQLHDLFSLLRATPEQRARAFLEVVKDANPI